MVAARGAKLALAARSVARLEQLATQIPGSLVVPTDMTNPDAVQSWYAMWWKKASETWNFDFFKIDGQPEVAAAYAKAANGGGLDPIVRQHGIGQDQRGDLLQRGERRVALQSQGRAHIHFQLLVSW